MVSSLDIRQTMRRLGRLDYFILLIQMSLLTLGVLFIYGAGMDYGEKPSSRWLAQVAWIGVGGAVYLLCALVDYRTLGNYSWLFFIGGLFLFGLVFIAGGREAGARSMLRISGFNIQVSEPMKAATLLFVAWFLSHPILRYSTISPLFIWAAIIILPFGMIVLHGDGGTALVFLPFSFAILFLNGLKKRWIFILLAAILIIAPLGFHLLKPYQKMRLLVFMKTPCESVIDALEPMMLPETTHSLRRQLNDFVNGLTVQATENSETEDKEHALSSRPHQKPRMTWDDWNARQVLYAVGSGRLTGRGYRKGIQHTLGFLPRSVAPTDFIFAVICEEKGFAGACAVIVLFCLLIMETCRTGFRADNPYGASIAIGAAVIYMTHAVINIGMCVGMAPIIGIPLPFVSYGGSCIIAMMMIGGLVQSVHIHTESISFLNLNEQRN